MAEYRADDHNQENKKTDEQDVDEQRIVLFESADGEVSLPVAVDIAEEEVWLNREQLAILFARDVKTIGKHVNNALREELFGQRDRVVAKIATTAADGKSLSG